VARAGQKELVRFDQPAKESGEEAPDQVPIETVEVLMDLDGEQQDAVGTYWKSMRQSRKRQEPIVESDSEEEKRNRGKRRFYIGRVEG